MLKKWIKLGAMVRSIVTWPFRVLAMFLGVPNFKIIYKSGKCQYVFLLNISRDSAGEWNWTYVGSHSPIMLLGADDISAVFQLY